jgi:hypothetical protein
MTSPLPAPEHSSVILEMSINQERCYPTHYDDNRNFMQAGVDGGREPPALKRVDKLPSCLRQKRRRGHSH